MTEKQLRLHIAKIYFCRFMLFIFCVVAVLGFASASILTDRCYTKWISVSEGTTAQRLSSIERGIDLKPGEAEGYRKLLDLLMEDGTLTVMEHTRFRALLNANQGDLHKNVQEAAALYQHIAFTYLASYDADPQERMKTAYPYLELAQEVDVSDPLIKTVLSVYIELCSYSTEYIWASGINREPTAAQVNDLLWRVSSTVDSFNKETEEDRLAFSCCVASLLNEHRAMWVEMVGFDDVDALANKLILQTSEKATTATAVRLQAELKAYMRTYLTEMEGMK